MLHATQPVPVVGPGIVRAVTPARTIPADRLRAAALFGAVVDASGGNCAAARALACDEAFVRLLRRGARPVRLEHVMAVVAVSTRAAQAFAAEARELATPRSVLPVGLRAGRIAKECGEAVLALVDPNASDDDVEREIREAEAELAGARADRRAVG